MIHLLTVSAALHLFVMLVGCNSMKQVINSDHDVPEQAVSFASIRERKSLTLLLHLLIHPLTSISQFSCSTLKNTVFSNCPSSCRIGKLGISRHRVNSISRGFGSDWRVLHGDAKSHTASTNDTTTYSITSDTACLQQNHFHSSNIFLIQRQCKVFKVLLFTVV